MALDDFNKETNDENTNTDETSTDENPSNSVVVEYKDPNAVELETKEEFKLPEKFKSTEDLLKSYNELEKKLSSGNKPEGDTNETKENEDDSSEKDGHGLLDNLGDSSDNNNSDNGSDTDEGSSVDEVLSKIEEKYKENEEKELNQEAIDELKKAGLSELMIKNTVKGWNADKQDVVNANQAKIDDMKDFEKGIYEKFGSKDNYNNAFKWLKTQEGGEDIIKEYMELVDEGKKSLINITLDSIQRQYKIAEPVQGSSNSGTGDVYQTEADYHADVRKYKFTKNAAFEKIVTEKAKRSGML